MILLGVRCFTQPTKPSFKNPTEQDYINFLWDALKTNYEAEKYPFAFLAYHMLFMCFVCFERFLIESGNPEERDFLDFAMKNKIIDKFPKWPTIDQNKLWNFIIILP